MFVLESAFQLNLLFFCQRDAFRMLGDEEDFSTTSKNSDYVGIGIDLSSSSHVLFCTKNLVEPFQFGVFVDKDNLPAILDHTMTCIAEKGKDSLMWIALEKTT